MAIVYQKDKRSGITYAYESKSWWDKEKKQSRSKRKLIGRLNEETHEIVETDGRCRKDKPKAQTSDHQKQTTDPFTTMDRYFYGATYLLDKIGDELGITHDLKISFPGVYKQILSIAYYLILEDNNPLYRFEKWGSLHEHPYGNDIPSQRSSDLFASITTDQITQFCRAQGKRRLEKEYWAYDSTSISSYSECLKQVQYGKNKEDDKLAQLNLLLVFGENSGLPFYYRKLAGNIPDVKTVKNLLADLDVLGFNKVKLVMDRGFYSRENINALYKEHFKFLLAAQTSLTLIRTAFDSAHDEIRSFQNYDENCRIYGHTISTEWDYEQDRPYKGDTLKEKRRLYIHLYYNGDRAADEEQAFDQNIAALYRELTTGKRVESQEKQYDQYFTVKQTPVRGIQIIANDYKIREAKRYFGYFSLISNEKMDAKTALLLYLAKDIVEKGFGNFKDRLNGRRQLVSSERSLDGKLFVEFVALIFLSYINKRMQETGLYSQYSMQQMLDKLDVIECFISPDNKLRVGEILEKQKQIFSAMGFEPPKSL